MSEKMKATDIGKGGKLYIMVNERVKFFNANFPNGAIRSELIEMTDRVIVKTFVYPDAKDELRYFTGFAYEMVGSSQVNKTSALENCETSAVGRALGFLGIGIDVSIASMEEVDNAVHQQNQKKAPVPYSPSKDEKTEMDILLSNECWTSEQVDAYRKFLKTKFTSIEWNKKVKGVKDYTLKHSEIEKSEKEQDES